MWNSIVSVPDYCLFIYFSHIGLEYPFLWLSEIFFCLGLLVSTYDKIAVSNCQSLLYIEPQELLLQHLFWAATMYIYKHFVEHLQYSL